MTNNRYLIAVAGVAIQVALGAVYAWSVFRTPLATRFGWSISEVTLTFTISIFVLGVAAFFGGLWLNKSGPRIVAVTGGLLYGVGVILASLSNHSLWWLYLSYGVIGGAGLGFGYIVPVAVLVKWFPDRRGLITGIAVGGFGAGALVTAPIATALIRRVGVLSTFAYLGIAYLLVTVVAGLFMKNPPEGWQPQGAITKAVQSQRADHDYSLREAAWQALFDQAQLKAGQTVLIHGAAGNVGAYAAQSARRPGLHIVATAGTDDIPAVRDLGANTMIDFQTHRFEEEVRDVDAVIDLVGGKTQERSFQVLRRGGKLVSAVSNPDPALAQRYGVEAAFFLVDVKTRYLAEIANLIDSGNLKTHVGAVLPLRNARESHLMLEGALPRPKGKIVLAVRASS